MDSLIPGFLFVFVCVVVFGVVFVVVVAGDVAVVVGVDVVIAC